MDTNSYYYQISKKASSEIDSHTGLLFLQKKTSSSMKVLDVGCGEGTRLNLFLSNLNSSGFGVDINNWAISKAKKQFPKYKFSVTNGDTLPFLENTFDLVYSCFTLEHTQNPESFIQEMIRVCALKGRVVIICPNFGSPNRRSPVSLKNPLMKLITGFWQDLLIPFKEIKRLDWDFVTPSTVYKRIDDDTTVEPYILTLKKFLSRYGIIEKASSLWELESPTFNPRKLIISFLGKKGVFPFKYWGPQIFVSLIKNQPK